MPCSAPVDYAPRRHVTVPCGCVALPGHHLRLIHIARQLFFLLAVAIFEPISSRSPPPFRSDSCSLLPAPSSRHPSPVIRRPSPIVHRPSSQPRTQALVLRPPARRRTDLIPSSACAHGHGHGYGHGSSILPITCCLLWAVATSTTVRNNSKPWLFHVESDGPGGAQRVQTILLHTKDHYHLEPRARASTFGSAPFLIYSHLVFLDLISMLQAHRAPRVSAPPPQPNPTQLLPQA